MIAFKSSNVIVVAITSIAFYLSKKTAEAGVVYYIKPFQSLLPPRSPLIGYGVIPISPAPAQSPPLRYIDYKWLNVKNAAAYQVTAAAAAPAVPLPVQTTAVTLLKFSPFLPPVTHLANLSPLSLQPALPFPFVTPPFSRRLQFIRLRRDAKDKQIASHDTTTQPETLDSASYRI